MLEAETAPSWERSKLRSLKAENARSWERSKLRTLKDIWMSSQLANSSTVVTWKRAILGGGGKSKWQMCQCADVMLHLKIKISFVKANFGSKAHYSLIRTSRPDLLVQRRPKGWWCVGKRTVGASERKEKSSFFMPLMSWRLCKEISYLNLDHLFFMHTRKKKWSFRLARCGFWTGNQPWINLILCLSEFFFQVFAKKLAKLW